VKQRTFAQTNLGCDEGIESLIKGGAAMGVMRLLPVLFFFGLLGGQILFQPDHSYATNCMCDQACPQPGICNCNSRCAVTDSYHSKISDSSTIQVRNLSNSLGVTTDNSENGVRSGSTLIAIPHGFLKLQCQRLKEMLNWAGESRDGSSAFQQILH
jgi:hypothetical protein